MSEIVNESLKKIAKASTIVVVATVINLLFSFIERVLLIRYMTQSEYGLYSLALAIVAIFITISTIGLNEGSTRYIAFFKGKNLNEKAIDVVYSSIWIALISSTIVFLLCYFISDFVAINIFNMHELSYLLKLFAITIPASVFINVIVAIFRGFNQITVKILFYDIMRPIFFVTFLIVVILYNQSFLGMVYAHVISIVITFILLIMYCLIKYNSKIKYYHVFTNTSLTKKLFLFSLPLLAVNSLIMLMSWTDTLMIGYFKTPEEVGLYNAAVPIARFITIVVSSVGFLYVPIISQLYGKNQIEELKRSYAISTKWAFLWTVPLFFILFVFPDIILNLFFGESYIDGSLALQFLILGYIFNSYFGLNYYTLISMGKSRFIMYCSAISAIINIALNIILIPPFGIFGAAFASALSFAIIEVLMTVKLYNAIGVHPFTKKYLKVTFITIVTISIFYRVEEIITGSVLIVFLSLISFLILYILSMLVLNCFDEEDLMIAKEIKNKIRI